MQELIERLEKATGTDRQLDALIEVQVRRFEAYRVGLNDKQRAYWNPVGNMGEVESQGTRYHAPLYTGSIDAAIRVVPADRLYDFAMTPNGPCATVWDEGTTCPPERYQVKGSTPAIAICLAALKAY